MRHRLPAMLSAPDGLGPRFVPQARDYRRFFGLRTLLACSSVASGRIEFVSQRSIAPLFYGLSVHFQLLSTPCRHDAVTFSYLAGSSASEGLAPSVHAHFQAHECARPRAQQLYDSQRFEFFPKLLKYSRSSESYFN